MNKKYKSQKKYYNKRNCKYYLLYNKLNEEMNIKKTKIKNEKDNTINIAKSLSDISFEIN